MLHFLVLSFLALPALVAGPAQLPCAGWSDRFGVAGLNGPANAFAAFDDGAGPVLFVGGEFTLADTARARRIARWNGATWSALPQDIDHNAVVCMTVFDDGSGPALYVAGSFSYIGDAAQGTVAAPGIARWNGTSWSALGNGLEGTVLALCAYDDGGGARLYAGGAFTASGATPLARIARWNPTASTWEGVGGGANAPVRALAVHDEGAGQRLFAGGEFTALGAVPAGYMGRWNGTQWGAVGSTIGAAVNVLMSWTPSGSGATRLLAGGDYPLTGGSLLAWDGANWSALGSGPGGYVKSLAVFDDGAGPELYAGGTSSLARWNGSVWAHDFGWLARALLVHDDGSGAGPALLLGGQGFGPDGVAAMRNGQLDALTTSLAPDGNLTALHFLDDGNGPALFASGIEGMSGELFAQTGPTTFGIGRFDGQAWSTFAVGPSANSMVRFDVVPGGLPELCLGGHYGSGCLAIWNGTSFAYSGTVVQLNDTIRSLCVFDDGTGAALYATGRFPTIDGVAVGHVARYSGGVWIPLGSGLDWSAGFGEEGYDLKVFDDGSGAALYVCGSFDLAGGTPCSCRVARWNGSQWSTVGTGASLGLPKNLAVLDLGDGPALFTSGNFTQLDGAAALNVARWDGIHWVQVGNGIPGINVNTLAAFDDGTGGGRQLYAGKDRLAASLPILLRLEGSSWIEAPAMLQGNRVADLHLFDGNQDGREELYVGGSISYIAALGLVSTNLAALASCAPVSSFCAGDAADVHVTTDCPCGNFGEAGRGCAWHAGPTGALLATSGATDPDALVLTASGMPASAPSTIFLKGDALLAQGVVFGDGVRCIGGALIRLGTKVNASGAASYPEVGNTPISVRGNTPPGSGLIGYYQTYYRNAAVFCTSATFNVTNAIRVEW